MRRVKTISYHKYHVADSQIVYTEMAAERKTEESIPCGSKKARVTPKKYTPLRAYCVGVCLRVCLPHACVSDPPCFYCSLLSAWKGGLCPIGVPGLCVTVNFHNSKSQNFKLSVSNPKNKYAAYLSVLSQISKCQGLGRENKH